jgi:hypothetical protein
VWLAGDLVAGADVVINLLGGPDSSFLPANDMLSVTTGSDVDISSAASLDVTMDGGLGADQIEFFYSGELDGLLRLRGYGGLDNDTLETTIHVKDFSAGTLDAKLAGDGGNDYLMFVLTDDSGGMAAIANALLDGGAGWDICSRTSNVTAINYELFPAFPIK